MLILYKVAFFISFQKITALKGGGGLLVAQELYDSKPVNLKAILKQWHKRYLTPIGRIKYIRKMYHIRM
jgi:hypothetical protein